MTDFDGEVERRDTARVAVVVAGAAALAIAGAVPFLAATTFITDDHLFLAFARYAPNPWVAFVRDQLGGESYRPLPMLLWWVAARIAGPSPAWFGAIAWLMHAVVAVEVAALVRGVRRDARAALFAAGVFFIAPGTRETAYWYAASTDLLATAFGVGAILALLRERWVVAAACFAAACASKESAVAIPLLAVVALRARTPALGARAIGARVAPLAGVAVGYLVVRTLVLRGLGGFGDAYASLPSKLVQLASGLTRAATGDDVMIGAGGWIAGAIVWAGLVATIVRSQRREPRTAFAWAPIAWALAAVLPLLAAPWIVGARYFYLASVGIAWLAGEALRRAPVVVAVAVVATLAGLASAQAVARRKDVVDYEARVAAARRAVKAGVAEGFTTFHIASGIKDLDLAVKEDRDLAGAEPTVAVLTDVPASFVALPPDRPGALDFLLAAPPLPPSGAYRFGDRRIAALARRGDDPSLDEVVARLPAIRFIRLRLGPGRRVIFRDVTEERRLEDSDVDEPPAGDPATGR